MRSRFYIEDGHEATPKSVATCIFLTPTINFPVMSQSSMKESKILNQSSLPLLG